MKWLYIYRDGKYKLVSAKTRSWERAEQKAREVRDTFDPIRQLQRRLEAQSSVDKSQIYIATAVDQFLKEIAHLHAEATRAKYKLTLARLLKWCATLETPATLLTQLDVATTRRWINSWSGAPTSLHNQHQRLIAFFNFCIEQGWIKDNPAKKIKRFHGSRRKRCPSPANNMRLSLRPPTTTTPAESSATGETTNSDLSSVPPTAPRTISFILRSLSLPG
jgi:hypothetical protein